MDICHALALLLGPNNVKGSCYIKKEDCECLKKLCLSITDRCYRCMREGYSKPNHSYFCDERAKDEVWPNEISLEQHAAEVGAVVCK